MPLSAAIHAIDTSESRDLDAAKARSLIKGWHARFGDEAAKWTVLEVERDFHVAVVNPETGGKSRTFTFAGKIDAIVARMGHAGSTIVEHKTTSDSVAPDSGYWDRLAMDSQISDYFIGADDLNPSRCIYNVTHKPGIRQKQGETVDEYEARLLADVLDRPDYYYRMREVGRLDSQIIERVEDVWSFAQMLLYFRRRNIWPRNTDACNQFGECEFFGLCAGHRSPDDYSIKQREFGNDALSNSRLSTLRTCPRKYKFRYEDLLDSGYTSDALVFGSLYHKALEAYFNALKGDQNGDS